jgi:phytoene/squalene synthetase
VHGQVYHYTRKLFPAEALKFSQLYIYDSAEATRLRAERDQDLDPDLLRSVIHWRIKDLHTKQPETVKDLEEYAEGTQGALQKLALASLGAGAHEGSLLAVKHVGIAMGIALVLRGTRFHAARNKNARQNAK